MDFISKKLTPLYLRNFVFGVEDSLVSTVGLLSGVAAADLSRQTILLTGLILVLVEAFSMAAGSFLSEHSAEAFARKSEKPSRDNFISGAIMFFSYFLSGFIPLLPYIIFSTSTAFWLSITCSIAALYALGIFGAKLSGIPIMRHGTRMAVVGGIAIALGYAAGILIPKL